MSVQRNHYGDAFTPKNPGSTVNATMASNADVVSAESVTFVTGAAGFRRSVRLDNAPIMNKVGDAVGSFWRSDKNLVDGTKYALYSKTDEIPYVSSLTETATSAAIVIQNQQVNMEELFDGTATPYSYVLVAQDSVGARLYGWVGAITASGNAYTISIFAGPSSATQSWNGDLTAFDNTKEIQYEIYKFDTSFEWVTGTILTQEVAYDPSRSDEDQLRTFANGDYAVDYSKGRILYRKATTGTSDTCNYVRRIST